ncbi:sensor histidine kinase [Aestuariivirga sp.]|jgi:two-component system sensor kinase FixL|uniref:sensor histidine kinase n=1 Tax=Aestuariivirga sp. TaxID=2650926 RepID=UPI003782F21D
MSVFNRLWSAIFGNGSIALAIGLLSIGASTVIAIMAYSELVKVNSGEDDARWSVFEVGFEYQRLLLAAERGDSLAELRQRGEIYMSRVLILRDAPLLAHVREGIGTEKLQVLFGSAHETDRLLQGLDSLNLRVGLISHLRADAPMIRKLLLAMARLDRQFYHESRADHNWRMLVYVAALEALMAALLVLSIVLFRTMRELRRAGRELAARHAAQNAILRSVDTAIVGLGPDGAVLYANPGARLLLGEAAGHGARPSSDVESTNWLCAAIAALLRDLPKVNDFRVQQKVRVDLGGGPRHYIISATATGSTDHASHILAITDVTTEEEAHQRRREYDERLGEASRVLAYATMSGGIVHEISQPLAAIRNYAYALKVSLGLRNASPEQHAIAERLGEEADRAIEVVRNVRRMGPQQAEDSGVCDIHEVIAHSIRLAALGVEPPPPVTVTSDVKGVLVAGSLPMIGQVVVNLLKNALSASTAAGRAGAEVKVMLREDSAEVIVADFGTGVPADAARTMFAPFVKSARGGMGLGLSICQRIADSLGGSLSWENSSTAGAVFRFTVPLARQGVTS